jgi:hypothetical protein
MSTSAQPKTTAVYYVVAEETIIEVTGDSTEADAFMADAGIDELPVFSAPYASLYEAEQNSFSGEQDTGKTLSAGVLWFWN